MVHVIGRRDLCSNRFRFEREGFKLTVNSEADHWTPVRDALFTGLGLFFGGRGYSAGSSLLSPSHDDCCWFAAGSPH